MPESKRPLDLTAGMLVSCRVGERTTVSPCRVIYVGPGYVTVEDPERRMWQVSPDRVEPVSGSLGP